MSGVFISYRRSEAQTEAALLCSRLTPILGDDRVFLDSDTIASGADFRRSIDLHLRKSRLLFVLIGQDWLETKDDTGRRRLDSLNDYVRLEIATALSQKLPIIPVLLNGAAMP